MDKAKKNTVIHAAADRMAANYKSSQIPMYGDALRMPNRNAVIEIIRDCQKLIFPVYYGDRDLLKLPPEQYSALLMEHIHEKLTRQITLTMPECDENCEVAYEISTAFIERIPAIQELLLKDPAGKTVDATTTIALETNVSAVRGEGIFSAAALTWRSCGAYPLCRGTTTAQRPRLWSSFCCGRAPRRISRLHCAV